MKLLFIAILTTLSFSSFANTQTIYKCVRDTESSGKRYNIKAILVSDKGVQTFKVSADMKLTASQCLDYVMRKNTAQQN